MKISTALFYERATRQVVDAQSRLAQTQARLATGKQLVSPSENPDQALAVDRLRISIQRQEGLTARLQSVDARLRSEESALRSINTMQIRFKELSLQGIDDSLSPDDRSSIARELEVLREQMLNVANSRDDQGHYLFGGARVGLAPFVADGQGRIEYRGDQTAAWALSDDRQLLEFNRAGTDAFPRVIRVEEGQEVGVGFFDALDDMIEAVRSSDRAAMTRGLGELDDMLTSNGLALVQTGADQNAIENQIEIAEEAMLRLNTTRSTLEDLDYAEAITRMNQEMMALESAMGSFAKVSRLSLFEYLNP